MSECPSCHRQLLSHNSPNCSWCGAEIPDANYQTRAAVGRQAFLTQQAQHDAMSLMRMEAIAFGDPWMMQQGPFGMMPLMPVAPIGPMMGPISLPPVTPVGSVSQPPAAQSAVDTEPPPTTYGQNYGQSSVPLAHAQEPAAEADETSDTNTRFRNLEL